jgi:hypothetical protein
MAAPWVGVQECMEHSVAGTTFLAMDKVDSGTIGPSGGDTQYSVGAGGQALGWRGMVAVGASVKGELQSIGLLANSKPATLGALPAIIAKLQGGPIANTDGARLMTSAYITRTKLSMAFEGILSYEHDFFGLVDGAATIASAAAKQTNTAFPWHGMDVQFNTASYKVQSWEVEWTTGITPRSSGDLKTAGVQRIPEWIEAGSFAAKMSATIRVPIAYADDFYADYPTQLAFKAICENSDSTAKTFTLDCTGGSGFDVAGGQPMEIVKATDAVLFKVAGTSTPNDLAVISYAIA